MTDTQGLEPAIIAQALSIDERDILMWLDNLDENDTVVAKELEQEGLIRYVDNDPRGAKHNGWRRTELGIAVYNCIENPGCKGCNVVGMSPGHDGSRYCKSGSIASGGTRAHCTCDTCF
jgi:hypothetical protein